MLGTVEAKARLACLYAGAVWGLFWIPLRAMQEAGLHDLWITTIYFMLPSLCMLPILGLRWRATWRGGLALQLTVLVSGAALALYSAAIVFTDVVRALMLFYLMPIWSILLARAVLNERITAIRVISMGLAALGVLTLFGLGAGVPIPRNVGDWMGLAAGMLWAVAMVRVRMHGEHNAADLTVGFFLWGLILSLGFALAIAPSHVPSIGQTAPVLPLLVGFVLLLVIPGSFAGLWGPKFLNPGVTGLLFMSEFVVGTISAALLAGEPFGIREFAGVMLIAGASLLEPLSSVLARDRARN